MDLLGGFQGTEHHSYLMQGQRRRTIEGNAQNST